MKPLLLLNAVGLTPNLLAHAPRLSRLAEKGWAVPLKEVLPAVTCSAQATILTGEPVNRHGVVANGWLFRDTNEVRFWQQCNRLIQAEPVYETAKKRAQERGRPLRTAKLFWWFNQGAAVDISVTPKPWYGIDGNKAFDITGTPEVVTATLKQKLGRFPFPAFWGPMAGAASTQWIAKAATEILRDERPDLSLVYLPHLDYQPQRAGPSGCDMVSIVQELDDACAPLLDEAERQGARVWVVSEYGHCDVKLPVFLNRVLRSAGLLNAREGPFGEQLDLYGSRAYAVVDHQLAHVYVADRQDVSRVRDLLAPIPGVAKIYALDERAEIELDHPRSGELVALAEPNAWFAYPFWQDDHKAPDYARSVAIHHKPGFDPCELFFDSRLRFPKLYAARKLLCKKLGFRMKMDVVPLDAAVVRGSHGLIPADPNDGAIFIGDGDRPEQTVRMTDIRDRILQALDLTD